MKKNNSKQNINFYLSLLFITIGTVFFLSNTTFATGDLKHKNTSTILNPGDQGYIPTNTGTDYQYMPLDTYGEYPIDPNTGLPIIKLDTGSQNTSNTTNTSQNPQYPNSPARNTGTSPSGYNPAYPNSPLLPMYQGSAGTVSPQNQPLSTDNTFLNSIIPTNLFQGKPLTVLLNQIFYIGLIIAVILALVMIIRGGIQYMTTDASDGKTGAKNRIQAAVGGLVLAFSAVLILNTINPSLTNLGLNIQQVNITGVNTGLGIDSKGNPLVPSLVNGWVKDSGGNFIKKQSDGSTLVSQPDGQSFTLYPDGSKVPGFKIPPLDSTVGTPVGIAGTDEQSVRSFFAQNGVDVKKPICTPADNGVKNGCTSVTGLGSAAMSGVVSLKNASGANIQITGGTEGGHITHGVGNPIVDLGKDYTLSSYIENNAVSKTSTSRGIKYTLPNGNTFLDEGDHWHAQF